MKRTCRTAVLMAVVTAAPGLAARASADPISLIVSAGPSLQQTENRPCIIGDPSCHNRGTLAYTLIPPHDRDDTLSSPTYTVDQLRRLLGSDAFTVGIDLNQAMGHDDGAYTLESFTLSVDGVTAFSTDGPTKLFPMNPGNGYSDASITGFSLAGLPGSATLVFTATFSGATAGREQYFLRAGSLLAPTPSPAPTPEPASLLLLGAGLGGILLKRVRRA
jgi:PEP-CTERM motif